MQKKSLVITSISSPNDVLKAYAKGCLQNDISYYVIGDVSSPKVFSLEGCQFFDIEDQQTLDFKFAKIAPVRHYARKNIGYLLAIRDGNKIIIETDDDNFPFESFWDQRQKNVASVGLQNTGWTNIYKYFSDERVIWARGFPLEKVLDSHLPEIGSLNQIQINCPIQQGLADENPDVDAIYRLVKKLLLVFKKGPNIALGHNSWHPFNSQNTTWFDEAFPLLYLPSYCSFRMTDIWRSYVAQRIAWECGWSVLYHSATVYQQRNEHSLIKDFEQEIPGYLQNMNIVAGLEKLNLKSGVENIYDNLRECYKYLVDNKYVGEGELALVEAWIFDCSKYQ